jgi:hypothetical protein
MARGSGSAGVIPAHGPRPALFKTAAAAGRAFSDGCDDDLVVLADCAIIGAQIEAGFLRFDARQQ